MVWAMSNFKNVKYQNTYQATKFLGKRLSNLFSLSTSCFSLRHAVITIIYQDSMADITNKFLAKKLKLTTVCADRILQGLDEPSTTLLTEIFIL
ncbi:hypothetical protein LCGC14_1553940 [marine sediment metagenome]|uniref:Uncharacterized protein n=1 Tax=marine sediment metagenome TaxID=412755 RepID=A0A0F9IPJ8_9ZZZZ